MIRPRPAAEVSLDVNRRHGVWRATWLGVKTRSLGPLPLRRLSPCPARGGSPRMLQGQAFTSSTTRVIGVVLVWSSPGFRTGVPAEENVMSGSAVGSLVRIPKRSVTFWLDEKFDSVTPLFVVIRIVNLSREVILFDVSSNLTTILKLIRIKSKQKSDGETGILQHSWAAGPNPQERGMLLWPKKVVLGITKHLNLRSKLGKFS